MHPRVSSSPFIILFIDINIITFLLHTCFAPCPLLKRSKSCDAVPKMQMRMKLHLRNWQLSNLSQQPADIVLIRNRHISDQGRSCKFHSNLYQICKPSITRCLPLRCLCFRQQQNLRQSGNPHLRIRRMVSGGVSFPLQLKFFPPKIIFQFHGPGRGLVMDQWVFGGAQILSPD